MTKKMKLRGMVSNDDELLLMSCLFEECYGGQGKPSINYWLLESCNRKREIYNLINLFNNRNNKYSHQRFLKCLPKITSSTIKILSHTN